jgi:UDP-GlcNAc:undecaprenyl-phosphate GlcNAc-1-phosphate transferase
MLSFWWTASIAFIVTMIFITGMSPVARKIGLVDLPGGRKHHRGQVPLIGGLGVAIGMMIGLLLLAISLSTFRAYLAGVVLLLVVGVLDDFNELSPRLRLVAQLCVALFLSCWAGLQLDQFGAFLGFAHFSLGLWAFPCTVIVVIALINAVNMIDGVNGVAAGTSFLSLVSLCIMYSHLGELESYAVLLVICASILGFLIFNYPIWRVQNRLVFLGDAGSTLLGFSLAWFGIKLNVVSHGVVSPVLLLWLFIVPVFDLVSVTLRRVFVKRVSPFSADREHMHHVLKALGLRDSMVSLVMIAFSVLGNGCALGFYFYPIANNIMFAAFVGVFAVYFVWTQYFWLKHRPLPAN